MKRVVVVLALLVVAFVSRPVQVSTAVDPAVVGQWTGVLSWPSIGVHSHMLSTGKVLTWEQGSQATHSNTPAKKQPHSKPVARLRAESARRLGRRAPVNHLWTSPTSTPARSAHPLLPSV